jgi:hypothetical protein
MRNTLVVSRIVAIGVVAITYVSVVLAASNSAAESGSGQPGDLSPGAGCQKIEGLTEQTVSASFTGPQKPYPLQGVGQALIYSDTIYNAANHPMGHAVGYVKVIEKRQADGHIVTTYEHTADLSDGSFTGTGYVDRTALLQGAAVVFSIQGRTGVYAGKTGILTWQLQHVPPVPSTRVNLTFNLCG